MGEGHPIVLFPDLASHIELARIPEYGPWIERLSRNFRVILIDMRGVGSSARVNAAPTTADMATDVEAVIASLGIDRYALVKLVVPRECDLLDVRADLQAVYGKANLLEEVRQVRGRLREGSPEDEGLKQAAGRLSQILLQDIERAIPDQCSCRGALVAVAKKQVSRRLDGPHGIRGRNHRHDGQRAQRMSQIM